MIKHIIELILHCFTNHISEHGTSLAWIW